MLLEVVRRSKIYESINRKSGVHEKFVAKAGTWEGKEGKYVECARINEGGEGGGTIGEEDAMPVPDSHGTTRSRWFACNDYERRKLTGLVLDSSKTNKQAIKEVLAEAMRNARKDMARRWNWQIARGDGSGLIASVTGANVAGAIPVDDSSQFRKGMQVSVYKRSDGSIVSAAKKQFKVASIDSATQVTLTAYGTQLANGDLDNTWGLYFRNGYGQHPFGMEAACSDANPSNQSTRKLGNTDRAADTTFNANIVDADNEAISIEDNIDQVVDACDIASDETPDLMWMHHEQWNRVGHELRESVRYSGMQKRTKAGFSYIEYNDMEFHKDRDIKRDRAFAINSENVERYVLTPTTLLDRGNGYLQPVTDSDGDKDAWVFTMVTRHAWTWPNPITLGRIKNLAVGV